MPDIPDNLFMIVVAIAAFLCGIYSLVTGDIRDKHIAEASEENRKCFARICGIVMLILAVIAGAFVYLQKIELARLDIIVINAAIVAILCLLIAAVNIARKGLNK